MTLLAESCTACGTPRCTSCDVHKQTKLFAPTNQSENVTVDDDPSYRILYSKATFNNRLPRKDGCTGFPIEVFSMFAAFCNATIMSRMASSGIAVREPTSRTYMVRSGSAYSFRSHLTSKLGSTSISGFLLSASGLSCQVTHSW
jgi:hypothetical protein